MPQEYVHVKINGSHSICSREDLRLLERGFVPAKCAWMGDTLKRLCFREYRIYFAAKDDAEKVRRVVQLGEHVLTKTTKETTGYEDLARILNMAYEQAASGKGKERHANGKPFDKQPIMEIGRMTGLAYHTGQAMKKIQEAHKLLKIKGKEAAIRELLGAEVYIAAAIKLIEEMED